MEPSNSEKKQLETQAASRKTEDNPVSSATPTTSSPQWSPALKNLPHKPGVYIMRDQTGGILYIGKAIDLRKRAANYFRPAGLDPRISAFVPEIRHIDYIIAQSEREALIIEQRLIYRHQPPYNILWRDDKTYPYVKISMNEDFPRIGLTREKTREPGARYFGPYPHTAIVQKLLRWIWRSHLFPLRPCEHEFSAKQKPRGKRFESCLYLHTGDCPGPCMKASKKEYRRIAERAVMFFEGKHDRLRRALEKEMKIAAKNMNFEHAAHLRDNLEALAHMRERVTFRALRPEDVLSRIQATNALQQLQEALVLPKPPLRIEAFDISHFQAAETVASMVTFHNGKPAKSGYRKYIIRGVHGVNDFASMEEVVSRRYKRVLAEGLTWPDLVLIDGGPGQLSAALKALGELKIRRVPIAALAKEKEEIYLPNQKEPVRLPKDSPALQILQRVRDESHRFAVTFHRLRRGKSLFRTPSAGGREE